MANELNTPSVKLKQIPPNVYEFLLDKQSDAKKNRGTGMYSIERTIYKVLEDHMRLIGYRPKPTT